MLDNYRTLSQDAVMLEGNNHSLELEAAETKFVSIHIIFCFLNQIYFWKFFVDEI